MNLSLVDDPRLDPFTTYKPFIDLHLLLFRNNLSLNVMELKCDPSSSHFCYLAKNADESMVDNLCFPWVQTNFWCSIFWTENACLLVVICISDSKCKSLNNLGFSFQSGPYIYRHCLEYGSPLYNSHFNFNSYF